MFESPLKKVKLTEEQSSCDNQTLLPQLPNELLFHITDFLIGNNHLNEKDLLLSLRFKKHTKEITGNEDEEGKKHEQYYQQYIPPFENIKTLLNFIYCNKQICQSLTGDSINQQPKENEETNIIAREWNEVDNYWLERINFYEKYLYWIRTISFDNLLLGTGDLTAREIDEMCKTQTLIQRIERGLIVDEKDAIDKESSWGHQDDNEDEDEEENSGKNKKKALKKSEEPKPLSQEKVNEDLFNRLKLLEFKKEDFINNEVLKNTSLFQFFLFRILILSLKMFYNIETNGDFSDGCGAPENNLLSEKYLETYYDEKVKGRSNVFHYHRYYANVKAKDESLPTYGLVIRKDNGWKRFYTNTKLNVIPGKLPRENCSLEGDDVLGPTLEEGELIKKLRKYCYIHFKSITDLSPFENLVFPNNIKYLTFSYSYEELSRDEMKQYFDKAIDYLRKERKERREQKGNKKNEEDFLKGGKDIGRREENEDDDEDRFIEKKKKKQNKKEEEEKPKEPILLGDFSFPGVRYLNIGANFDDIEPSVDIKVLEALLQKKRFQNLTHLTLSGFHIFDKLLSSDLLLQLQTLEIADSFKEEGRLVKFLNLLHKKKDELKHLKQLVVQLELDARNPTINSSQLEKYYNGLLENVCMCVGRSSISRFYYECCE
ncbi:hypothetical protein ABK040_015903 [Willaertia magna]